MSTVVQQTGTGSTAMVPVNTKKLSEIYTANSARVEKIVAIKNQMLAYVAKNEMTDELDGKLKSFCERARVAGNEIYNSRIDFTRKLDEVKSMCTSQEKKVTDAISQIQKHRDDYAKKKLEATRKAQAKIDEVGILRKRALNCVEQFITNSLDVLRNKLTTAVSKVTEETKDKFIQDLIAIPEVYPDAKFEEMKTSFFENVKSEYKNDTMQIITDVISTETGTYQQYWKEKIIEIKTNMRSEALRFAKEQDSKAKNQRAEELASANKNSAVEDKQQAASFSALKNAKVDIDTVVAKTEVEAVDSKKINTKVTMRVEDPKAWAGIAALWFTECFPTFKAAIENKKLDSMRKDLEKLVNKNRVIYEIVGVVYDEAVSAK